MTRPESDNSNSDSAYVELGFISPEKWETKANLAIRINSLLKMRKLTQAEASIVLGTTRPRISDLKRGQLDKFSLEKLLTFLTALDQDINIVVHPKLSDSAHIRVEKLDKPQTAVG
jgi:predicted XRE-type DNA-binding protein